MLSTLLTGASGPPMSVTTQPGWTAMVRTPRGARSMESPFTSRFSAALLER